MGIIRFNKVLCELSICKKNQFWIKNYWCCTIPFVIFFVFLEGGDHAWIMISMSGDVKERWIGNSFKAKYIWDNCCMFLKNESVKLLLV